MYYAAELGLQVLADSLIDSFCKGYIKLLKAYESIPPNLKHTPEKFAKEMNDIHSPFFNTPKKLIKYAVRKEKEHGLITEGVEGSYAAVSLDYKIDNPYYKPNHYNENFQHDKIDSIINPLVKDNHSVSNLLNQSIFKTSLKTPELVITAPTNNNELTPMK